MNRVAPALRQAVHRSWIVGLVIFPIAGVTFHLMWNGKILRETFARAWRYVDLATEPWSSVWEGAMLHYGPRLIWGEVVNLSFALFLAINVTLLFIALRVIWIALRPNSSFKPKPFRGSA